MRDGAAVVLLTLALGAAACGGPVEGPRPGSSGAGTPGPTGSSGSSTTAGIGSATATTASPSVSASPGTSRPTGAGQTDLPVMPALRSGLPWRSGVYVPGSNRSRVEAFGSWRTHPVDVVIDWPNRANWNDVVNPGWLYTIWKDTPYVKVFGVAMVPEEDATATVQRCAKGDYDGRWREFGRIIKARGLDEQTIVRLGWEFNGDWYKWAAWDTASFVSCWRHIVTSAREQAPKLRWDWTVNRGEGAAVPDPRKAYPGDAYVDIIGVDAYDAWPGASSESAWQVQYAGAYGLKFWVDFAAAHGKPFSVPEWGVYPGTGFRGHNGGDNGFYVRKMTEFFRANAARLAYEAYFDESAAYYAGAIFDPVQNPRASAAYLQAYRS